MHAPGRLSLLRHCLQIPQSSAQHPNLPLCRMELWSYTLCAEASLWQR